MGGAPELQSNNYSFCNVFHLCYCTGNYSSSKQRLPLRVEDLLLLKSPNNKDMTLLTQHPARQPLSGHKGPG